MEVQLSPEVEAEIVKRATSEGKTPAEVAQELIASSLRADLRFLAAIEEGFAELDAGQFITHEEVGKRIERRFR
jgi:predicted transcriptional regulator